MVHWWANGGWGRAVLSLGDGEEGAQWGPVKSRSAKFMILLFSFFSLQKLAYKGNTERGTGVFVFIEFSHMITGQPEMGVRRGVYSFNKFQETYIVSMYT